MPAQVPSNGARPASQPTEEMALIVRGSAGSTVPEQHRDPGTVLPDGQAGSRNVHAERIDGRVIVLRQL